MFLERFNELLNENYLNRKQFAERSGIPYPTVTGWTNLGRLPDYYALIKIADFFNCSVDYLMGRQGEYDTPPEPRGNSDDERDMLKNYRALSDENKQLINHLIKQLNKSDNF